MTTDLEDAVRATLAARAPAMVPPGDWNEIRARARRRTATGVATTAVAGAAAVGAVAVMSPWPGSPAEVAPSTDGHAQVTASAPTTTADAPVTYDQPAVVLDATVVDAALASERPDKTNWSAGPASRATVEQALGTLMASALVTDDSAQPQVVWSSAGNNRDAAQGPQVMVAVEQTDGWVLGFWDERRPFGTWVRGMYFGAMTAGSIEDRLVGMAIPDGTYEDHGGTYKVFVPPTAATRVVEVVTQAQVDAGAQEPVGFEVDLGLGFGGYVGDGPKTVRAYAADGSVLDEQTYME